MATLKEHQAAMVDLLANGSGIPASASRLAHAMHDVLEMLQGVKATASTETRMVMSMLDDATTPGLNDKALSKREKALNTDSPAKWPTPAEQRVKELENTIRQLKANNAKLKQELFNAKDTLEAIRILREPEESVYPKSVPFAPVKPCEHRRHQISGTFMECLSCGADLSHELRAEQAGCRKDDTQVCDHAYAYINMDDKTLECGRCGHNVPWPDDFNPEPPKAPK